MPKPSACGLFHGRGCYSERQQEPPSGVGFAGVSQPCAYQTASDYDFFFLFMLFELFPGRDLERELGEGALWVRTALKVK